MSLNVGETRTDSPPKKRFSVRLIRGNWCQRIKRLKKILADLRADMRFSLSPARPDSGTHEEVLIQHANKSEDTNQPENITKPEDATKLEEDNEPHEAPAAGFTEQAPKKEDEYTPAKHPNWHPSQVRSGSRITTAGKKYYKYLRVPPNSPDRGGVDTSLKYQKRVDAIRDESLKRPFIGQKTNETWNDKRGDLLLDRKNYNLIMMERMQNELRRLLSTLTCKCISVAGVMRQDEAVQAVEPREAPAKRVASRKAKEIAKEHCIVQGKDTIEDKQDLPTKADLEV
ncbi:uncharacterized protein N7487_010995 [Penicillium crustosum]|uniref:uncharacterized protein n=1 Tax=Penicillium crustosum TaxID=36656 RepID=UPI00238CDA02|nr:uncharacterized protein N7487_010995 [Penicillium crustosum]KAJ5393354.1 hypothetical protein N7487_010995 [Penicillium crustosum]